MLQVHQQQQVAALSDFKNPYNTAASAVTATGSKADLAAAAASATKGVTNISNNATTIWVSTCVDEGCKEMMTNESFYRLILSRNLKEQHL